jgi:hypothetical protein
MRPETRALIAQSDHRDRGELPQRRRLRPASSPTPKPRSPLPKSSASTLAPCTPARAAAGRPSPQRTRPEIVAVTASGPPWGLQKAVLTRDRLSFVTARRKAA